MKLNDIRPQIESSGELEEQFFSIQDQGMIFDILRNKMYSNPILAICREISCNARDAHREVGTPEIPVHIHLPNTLEPSYKIKDFGPGISPDRMSNIFIKYTASTKRDDNIQTGGFGLGAKTPFSYSDTFTIITNFNGKRYNYACFIDETRIGKLALLSEAPTTEPNGTEIIIPVKPADFNNFRDYTEQSTRHWDVKPVIKGNTFNYRSPTPAFSGTNWNIVNSNDYNRQIRVVIDGIEYPLNMNDLRKFADVRLIDSSRGDLTFYFGIGELSLSASREQIYLDQTTQAKLRDRLKLVENEIKDVINSKIQTFENLWEANIFYRKEVSNFFYDASFLQALKWNGIELRRESYISPNCPVITFVRGKYSRKNGTDPNKISRGMSRNLSFQAGSALYVNDLGIKDPMVKHVKKAFDDDPKLMHLQVVCPTDKVTIQTLNNDIHLDKMAPKMLSTITSASGRSYKLVSARLLVFKYDNNSMSFAQVSYSDMEADTNKKVLCKLEKSGYNGAREIAMTKNAIPAHTLRAILNMSPQTSFYGVDASTPAKRIEEDLSDLMDFEKFLNETVMQNKSVDYVAVAYARDNCSIIDHQALRNASTFKNLVKKPDSLYLKRIASFQKIKELNHKYRDLLELYEIMFGKISSKQINEFIDKNPDLDLGKIQKDYYKKYPLLTRLGYVADDAAEHISHYVNLSDKE